MHESARITDQLHRAVSGEPWHGPSLGDVLSDLDADAALARPIPDAHSIWEILLHISAWDEVVRRRLQGESINEPEEGDWPEVSDTSDEAWARTKERLSERHADLLDVVSRITAEGLLAKPSGPSTAYHQISGQLQHISYHAGQIAILRKGR